LHCELDVALGGQCNLSSNRLMMMMMMMVIKDAMFCASRLVSERSLGGGICAGGVAGTVAYG
jgi:hypothetical protein